MAITRDVEDTRRIAKAYAVAILEYYGMRYVEAQYSYKVNIIDYNYSITTAKLQASLQDGHIQGDLRTILAMVDYGVYYNDSTRELTVFPELLFDESSFADGAITLQEIAATGSLDDMEEDLYYGEEIEFVGDDVPSVPIMEQYFNFEET